MGVQTLIPEAAVERLYQGVISWFPWPGEVQGYIVFIGQPIVENAIKYGQKSGAKPLTIRITACLEGEKCLVTVANSCRWFETDDSGREPGTQLGSEYVQRCLAHYFGPDAALSFREENGWVVARVVFPVKEQVRDA
jgi:LytS/YehU family sensor histidine kinase